ncbi:unnamed protein product [Allacma fusca]|uniref:Uncharacterized protein n=1 Tax=Allacma fusca TaxID=39272 RepID=A0A8J2K747_9HEXA|nr:unnamed protein product [Allacma fusca]
MNSLSFPILKSKVSPSSLKMFLYILTFLILFPNFSQNKLTIEISYSEDPLTYTCDLIDFPEEQFVKCICLTGLWAFSISSINKPSKWKLIGDTGQRKCLELGEWVKRMEKISDSSEDSKLAQLGDSNHFAVANEDSWEIKTDKGKFCFPGAIPKGYCIYLLDTKEKIPEDQIQRKCSQDSKILKPKECHSFDPSEYEIDPEDFYGCKIVSNIKKREHFQLNRVKRDADQPTTRKPFNKTMLDEDFLSPEETVNYMGEMPMIESITDYMLSNVIGILKLNDKTSRRKRATTTKSFIPPVDLLRIMATLLKQMCPSIKPELFTLAQEVFLSHQRTVFQIKEPYIAYAPYKRILSSLEDCNADAKPFKFIQNLTTPNATSVVCILQNPPTTSFHIIRGDKGYHDDDFQVDQTVDIPPHAASDPNVHEPIVELAWKMFVIPHNHCYSRFVNYNNDHHTLTTTLLPYFSNQIQGIWLLAGTAGGNNSWASNSSGLMNYTSEYIWYNNLLGNISALYTDLNHCYSASKIQKNTYPWFLNRPNLDLTNQWSRRKRDVGSGTNIAGEQCLQNPADFL